ncbi:MAG: ABC transporter ATP-binding protein [Eubacteriales bacterium]|nr:ABC transporter ATP-binding protein [Eubacteriales bacterium]
METEALLKVTDLHVEFHKRKSSVYAVNGVSFEVYKGETFGIVGESGCGKSMTCKAVLGLLKSPGKVTEGKILFENKDLLAMSPKELNRVRGHELGMIFQEPMTALNPLLKIKSQIFDALDPAVYKTKQQKYDRALEMMKLVGIPSPEVRLEEYPHQFSGGMRQRVMIAIALCSGLKMVIADEPTTALDVTIQDQILKLINSLKEQMNMSVILITHDLGVVAQMCDRVAVMYAGMIMEMTDVVSLFYHPLHPYTTALMGTLPSAQQVGRELNAIVGIPPSLTERIEGCPFAPRCAWASEICRKQCPRLTQKEPGHFVRCHLDNQESGQNGGWDNGE